MKNKEFEFDEQTVKMLSFIELAEELLSHESLKVISKILANDCNVYYDIDLNGVPGDGADLTGEPGEPGHCDLSDEEISSLTNTLNIKHDKSGRCIILPHLSKNSFND